MVRFSLGAQGTRLKLFAAVQQSEGGGLEARSRGLDDHRCVCGVRLSAMDGFFDSDFASVKSFGRHPKLLLPYSGLGEEAFCAYR
jgi:hypothetical protein